ncbi:MAG: hypothetical protein QNL88_16030 [Acidobacteriota bacterium]|nr:hypothetical protein [Acidobacteriota bacterium]
MLGRYRWFVLAAAVIAVAVAFVLWRGRRLEPSADPDAKTTFAVNNVPVVSPDLNIDVGTVKWTYHPDYTDWACLVECREGDGCHAEVQLVMEYISLGKPQRLTLGDRLDAVYGETVRIGRAQRPSVKVDRIERVTVEVLAAFFRGDPTPTPME